jgi:Coenzyme PQQ synthesis protein D (PqqD)
VIPDFKLPVPAATTIFRPLPEGGVLFSTASEVYFGVNAVGARLWQLLPPICAGFRELCDTVAAEYPDAPRTLIENDARKFVDALLANGLAVEVGKGHVSGAPTDP